MTDLPRNLINEDGSSFDSDIGEVEAALHTLNSRDRITYRNELAQAVATHSGSRVLIVSGPGTGKSFLFMQRIEYWLGRYDTESVGVVSFVRKLVKDLESEVASNIDDAGRKRVEVSTLHALARGIIERNTGTAEQKFTTHIKIVPPNWNKMVWADVSEFHPDLKDASWDDFERQFYENDLSLEDGWPDLRETYYRLRLFYNAVSFADMIVLACEAVEENAEMAQHQLWIVDEFQDFNRAEERLIRTMSAGAEGALIAGDDDQALYQTLKASHPEIIGAYYADEEFAKAMLPYCSRCSYFICHAASAFIKENRDASSIRKIYLPLEEDEAAGKVQVVGTAAPTSAVHYIEKFIEGHKHDLEAHKAAMEAGDETDPFLLILTPIGEARFFNADKDRLLQAIAEWSVTPSHHSGDYWKVVDYCSAARSNTDNLAVRKVLAHEGISPADTHPLIVKAIDQNCALVELDDHVIGAGLAKCATVLEIVESEALGPPEKASELKEMISITNAERLAAELEDSPITPGGLGEGDEGDEALDMVGTLSPVEMLTFVGSKGLSAKHVILIGCDDVNMRQISELAFFVALTRARDTLHLITSLKAGGAAEPHQFVNQLPDDCCEFIIHKKSSASEIFDSGHGFREKLSRIAYGAQGGARRR